MLYLTSHKEIEVLDRVNNILRIEVLSSLGADNRVIKARVCNVVQKHILLYWVKWSCYPESSQYMTYSEEGMKIIRPLWQLQD